MKLLALALALALASSALADGPGKTIGSSPSKLMPGRPANGISCTPVIPDDANTVFHLYVCGGVVLDTKSNTITETGTLTRVAKTALGFPNGKGAEGVSGWASNKYLSVPYPVLNFSNAFIITALFNTTNAPANFKELLSAWSGVTGVSASGYGIPWSFITASQDQVQFNSFFGAFGGGGSDTLIVAPNQTVVYSIGRSGINYFHKVQTTAATTGSLGYSGWSVANVNAVIGYGTAATDPNNVPAQPFDGVIYELRATTTTPTTTVLNNLHTAIRSNP